MKKGLHKKYIGAVILTSAIAFYACGSGSTSTSTENSGTEASSAETIFRSKCALCHDFKSDKIGPALAGAPGRWKDQAQLARFIRHSQEVIKSGDPYAIDLFNKWHKSEMPAFPELSDAEIKALIEYLK